MKQAELDIILLRHLAARLSGQEPPKFKRQGKRSTRKVKYSQDFYHAYRKILAMAIPKRLARTFGWRTFYRLDADETKQHTVADPTFWMDMPARFTSAGTDAMWSILNREAPSRDGCTEWDALVAHMVWPQAARESFTEAWLHERNAHWMVRAYTLCNYTRHELVRSQRPRWMVFFEHPSTVPFSLRFVLIQMAGAFYAWAAQQLTKAIQLAESQQFQIPSDVSVSIYDPRHPRYFEWNAQAESLMGFEPVNRAIHCWTNDGVMGFDDDHFIESVCTQVALSRHQATIRDSLRHFGRISREL